MNGEFNLNDKIVANVERKAKFKSGLHFDVKWHWKAYRHGLLMWEEKYINRVVDEGLTYALSVAFKDGTKKTSWYILLFENDYTPVAGNKYEAPGFIESIVYNEANRPLWNCGEITANVITNGLNMASFTFNATKNIYGGALVSDNRKGVPGAAATWQPSYAYTVGRIVVPTGSPGPPYSPNGHFYKCTVAGTSGSSQPTWPPASPPGGTVVDGGVTWTDVGVISGEKMFSSGRFDIAKPVEADDIVKVSIEITANAIIV